MQNQEPSEIKGTRKKAVFRKIAFAGLALFVFIAVSVVAAIAYNNISLWSDASFARRLDSAISHTEKWVEEHRLDILKERNVALITMLRECNDLKSNPSFKNIVESFLNEPMTHYSRCWKREVDPNRPIDKTELNTAIANDSLDNKWALYAIAPDKAAVNPNELGLFEPERWHRRQLTHQLFALTMLRDRHGSDERLDKLIEHLCGRLNSDTAFSVPVVDIYIQRVTFVLRAGFPQEVRRRWVERIIANQQSDGGWNDRWLCFTTVRRKPIFSLTETPSDQHATVQAVLALYLVKYRYPEQFGLK
ncbi:MAG: hypothetical protein ABII09_05005 [Planctomycetota bacterium]